MLIWIFLLVAPHYHYSEPNSLCSYSLMLHMLREKAVNTSFMVFGLTRMGPEQNDRRQ